jgi:hypothetical protein
MKEGDIRTKPVPESIFVTAFIPDFQRYSRNVFQFPGPAQGVLAHLPLQIRSPLRAKGGNQAGLGLSRFRIAGKNNEPIQKHFFSFGHRDHREHGAKYSFVLSNLQFTELILWVILCDLGVLWGK